MHFRSYSLIIALFLSSVSFSVLGQNLTPVDFGGVIVQPSLLDGAKVRFHVTIEVNTLAIGPAFQRVGDSILVTVNPGDTPFRGPTTSFTEIIGPLAPGNYSLSYHVVAPPFDNGPTIANRIALQSINIPSSQEPTAVPVGNALAGFVLVLMLLLTALSPLSTNHALCAWPSTGYRPSANASPW
jgi:hypothetical protein